NRLASNSLLEGAVLGRRVGTALAEPSTPGAGPPVPEAPLVCSLGGGQESCGRDDIQQLAWTAIGLERDGAALTAAADVLARWRTPRPSDVKSAEDSNLLLLAHAMALSALHRNESRGAHWRVDAPEPATTARHSFV